MTKNSFSIIPAKTIDLPAVQEIAYEIWPTYYTSIISMDQIEYMLRNFYSQAALENQMEEGHQFFMAMEGEKPVGFMSLSPQEKKEWKIEKLYLLPETRGKGFGRKLIDFARLFAENKKAKNLILNVNRFNESRDFYFKLGFRIRQKIDIPLACFWLNDFILEMKLA
jgi:GNAT superfamily N-acetyltransferase